MEINYQTAPQEIVMRKLMPMETTQPGDNMLFDKQFFPVASFGIRANEFDVAVYRPQVKS